MAENLGISLYDGKLYHPENQGLGTRGYDFDCPGHRKIRIDLSAQSSEKNPVVMVHGFRYNPKSKGDDNPHNSTFVHWRKNILLDTYAYGFGWWSCPARLMLPGSVFKSWRNGRWNTYRYAWDLAKLAGKALAGIIAQSSGPVVPLCHSLGSRVVLSAIEHDAALPINRVVLMNGAELGEAALRIAKLRPNIKFFNLVVREDEVLKKFGRYFAPRSGPMTMGSPIRYCIGQSGLGVLAPPNWVDVDLDSLEIKIWAKSQGWLDIEGDNPNGYFDHWWTHKHEGNWPLIRALLKLESVTPPRA